MSDKIRVGDRFLVEVVAEERGSGCWIVRPQGKEKLYITASTLLASKRLPRTIKVGDMVTIIRPAFTPPPRGVLEWTDGTDALVRWPPGSQGLMLESYADITLADGETP